MKVSEFFAQLPEKDKILSKIKKFKEKARHKALAKNFECCASCGGELSSQIRSDYLRYTILETPECGQCLKKGPTRVFTLN
jgi:hypothetical protein